MVGIVKFINANKDVIGLKTTANNYSIIEVSDLNIELGDVLLGEIESLGPGTLFNITKSCLLHVVIHEVGIKHISKNSTLTP